MLGERYQVTPVLRTREIALLILHKKGIFRTYFKDYDAMGTTPFPQAGRRYT